MPKGVRKIPQETLADGGIVEPNDKTNGYEGEPEMVIPASKVDMTLGVTPIVVETAVTPEELQEKVEEAIETATVSAEEPKVETPKEEPKVEPPKEVPKTQMPAQSPSECKRPLRDMQLTEDQKAILLKDGLSNIVKTKPTGGVIPAVVSEDGSPVYTLIQHMPITGGVRIFLLMELDHRIVQDAFIYYKDNAINPTHSKFLELLENVSGKPGRLYTRIVPLALQ